MSKLSDSQEEERRDSTAGEGVERSRVWYVCWRGLENWRMDGGVPLAVVALEEVEGRIGETTCC